jgi:hypothetical protein
VTKMGLRLPLYPYLAAKGDAFQQANLQVGPNLRHNGVLERFRRYLSRPDVKRLQRNIIQGQIDSLNDDWFRPIRLEIDQQERPELALLLDEVGREGTIVALNTMHIVGNRQEGTRTETTRRLIRRIVEENIEVLSLNCPPRTATHSIHPYIDANVPNGDIFNVMPRNAMGNFLFFKRLLDGSKRKSASSRRRAA